MSFSSFSDLSDVIKKVYSIDALTREINQQSPFSKYVSTNYPGKPLTTFDLLVPGLVAKLPLMGRREWDRDPLTGFPICERGRYDEDRGVLSVWLKHERGMMHFRLWFEEENGEWVMKAGGW